MKIEAGLAAATGAAIFLTQAASAVASSPALDVMTQLVSALGPMGFVMWLVWRTTNHTIPRLAKSFEDAIDRQRGEFRETLTEQRADFMSSIDRERQVCAKLSEAIDKLADRERGR
jgi:hypothetical protein